MTEFISLLDTYSDLNDLIKNLSFCLTDLLTTGKVVFWYFNIRKLQSIIRRLEEDQLKYERCEGFDPEEIFYSYKIFGVKATGTFLGLGVLTFSGLFVPPILSTLKVLLTNDEFKPPLLPNSSWIPFNYDTPKMYLIALIYQAISMILRVINVVALDSFIMNLMNFIAYHFTLIQQAFLKITQRKLQRRIYLQSLTPQEHTIMDKEIKEMCKQVQKILGLRLVSSPAITTKYSEQKNKNDGAQNKRKSRSSADGQEIRHSLHRLRQDGSYRPQSWECSCEEAEEEEEDPKAEGGVMPYGTVCTDGPCPSCIIPPDLKMTEAALYSTESRRAQSLENLGFKILKFPNEVRRKSYIPRTHRRTPDKFALEISTSSLTTTSHRKMSENYRETCKYHRRKLAVCVIVSSFFFLLSVSILVVVITLTHKSFYHFTPPLKRPNLTDYLDDCDDISCK
ncbi:unnamed protein product [Brassicogethes aeneus]|uniref:Odorant receptor n=1 Tax=Brassicogethes aeneus TaxID=1431903 RepID=A0A9P0FLM0_BRAAE|nr:unnamed protein product [Brassicogethes aeneus]